MEYEEKRNNYLSIYFLLFLFFKPIFCYFLELFDTIVIFQFQVEQENQYIEYLEYLNISPISRSIPSEDLTPVDLNLIKDLWVPNVFIYNLKTFKVGADGIIL